MTIDEYSTALSVYNDFIRRKNIRMNLETGEFSCDFKDYLRTNLHDSSLSDGDYTDILIAKKVYTHWEQASAFIINSEKIVENDFGEYLHNRI